MDAINNQDEELKIREQQQKKADNQRQILEDWQRSIARRYPDPETLNLIGRVWASGFFDGEGHVGKIARGGSFNCEIDQVDIVNLERFQAAVGGAGQIKPRKWKKRGNEKPRYRWYASSQADLVKVWNAIGLFLSPAKQAGFASALSVPLVSLLNGDKPLPEGAVTVEVLERKPKKR